MMNNQTPGTLLYIKRAGQSRSVGLVVMAEEGHSVTFTLSEKDYEGMGSPSSGTIFSPDTLELIEELAEKRMAYILALRILECGDNNRRTLLQKLLRKGISPRTAEDTVARMEKLGYIKEEAFAYRQVVLCGKKGWSRKHTHAHLISHGFPSSIASQAIAQAEEAGDVDYKENRRLFIQKKQAQGLTYDALQKALWRAGF